MYIFFFSATAKAISVIFFNNFSSSWIINRSFGKKQKKKKNTIVINFENKQTTKKTPQETVDFDAVLPWEFLKRFKYIFSYFLAIVKL